MKLRVRLPCLTLISVALCLNASATPLIVAHRGASKDAPENTIPAFEMAWRQKADAIEGDFYLTGDGEIVCIHDSDTSRVASVKKVVKDSTLEELRQLDVGAWFGARWKETKIPTIAEVFETIPSGKKIYIEVKCGPEILPKLYQEIRASGLEREQVVIISFNATVIEEIKTHTPNVKAIWLSSFTLTEDGTLTPSADETVETLERIQADGFSSFCHHLVDQKYVDQIVEKGFEYHVWTVDDVDEAKRFSALGAGSITTNRPHYVRDGIGLWQE